MANVPGSTIIIDFLTLAELPEASGQVVYDIPTASFADWVSLLKWMDLNPEHMKLIWSDLMRYCAEREIPFVPFNNWASILAMVQDVHDGGLQADRMGDRLRN
ncbi:hypothetical protein EYZ11_009428 [Aspergillus tanneri]|uniref:Uncharacterized protein n=1 Tax=Aspergillus tanneri TaxID=1220188 RepID=A0A4V3UNH1_9EURO|nr:uncharacterized protein ATNIH1004_000026 [Aspergillus tanneri]KAA8651148.1 hypothetical protein ATNIH1004_000026 [Aspergillus tanneri]THC91114.1 hypothetical protein EYZ11_009428 [Aspergillus tanneri]